MLYNGGMAFALTDFDAFIEAINADPQLRERVVKAILHEDFLALPSIVARLGDRLDQVAEQLAALTVRMDALTVRMDALTVHMDALTERMDAMTLRMDELIRLMNKLDGRTGNLEGWRFEAEYRDRLASHLARRYRGVRPLVLGNVQALLEALDDGRIADPEWDDIIRLDAAAHVRPRAGGDDLVVVMELSKTVGIDDVERVARRADIIRRAGFVVDACVDGEQIDLLAQRRLAGLGVISFVDKLAEPA